MFSSFERGKNNGEGTLVLLKSGLYICHTKYPDIGNSYMCLCFVYTPQALDVREVSFPITPRPVSSLLSP